VTRTAQLEVLLSIDLRLTTGSRVGPGPARPLAHCLITSSLSLAEAGNRPPRDSDSAAFRG
jgi:hypothetical protein